MAVNLADSCGGKRPLVRLWDKGRALAREIVSALAEEEMRIHQQELPAASARTNKTGVLPSDIQGSND